MNHKAHFAGGESKNIIQIQIARPAIHHGILYVSV